VSREQKMVAIVKEKMQLVLRKQFKEAKFKEKECLPNFEPN